MVTKKEKEKEKEPVCDICCENLNKSSRKLIQCNYCKKGSCLTCAKTYISTELGDPHCMFCKVAWNYNFIKNTFPSAWLSKDYRHIREKILFDMEIAKIPETQELCKPMSEKKSLIKDKQDCQNNLKTLKMELENKKSAYEICNQDIWLSTSTDVVEKEKLESESHDLFQQKSSIDREIEAVIERTKLIDQKIDILQDRLEHFNPEPSTAKYTQRFKCPISKCRGYVDASFKCGICREKICSECREVSLVDHKCDVTILQNIKLLKEDSKPCPNCASLIFKISGCDQMWCIVCKTGFSWDSGNIETFMHNPHYFDWVFRQNEGNDVDAVRMNHEDLVCNDEKFTSTNNSFQIIRRIREKVTDAQKREIIMNIVRLNIHIMEIEMPISIPLHERNNPKDPNQDIRLQFLMNEIDEDSFRNILQKREKERIRKHEFRQIYETYVDVTDDHLKRFFTMNEMTCTEFLEYMNELKDFTNEAMTKLSDIHNVKSKTIGEDFSDLFSFVNES